MAKRKGQRAAAQTAACSVATRRYDDEFYAPLIRRLEALCGLQGMSELGRDAVETPEGHWDYQSWLAAERRQEQLPALLQAVVELQDQAIAFGRARDAAEAREAAQKPALPAGTFEHVSGSCCGARALLAACENCCPADRGNSK
jgi:hypothetical protein